MSTSDTIAEVWIDDAGHLHVKPSAESFPMVYRAAMEVYWDEINQSLFGPAPKEWSYLNWFNQIVAAVRDEYGVDLRVIPSTNWRNVPDTLRNDILSGLASR